MKREVLEEEKSLKFAPFSTSGEVRDLHEKVREEGERERSFQTAERRERDRLRRKKEDTVASWLSYPEVSQERETETELES